MQAFDMGQIVLWLYFRGVFSALNTRSVVWNSSGTAGILPRERTTRKGTKMKLENKTRRKERGACIIDITVAVEPARHFSPLPLQRPLR